MSSVIPRDIESPALVYLSPLTFVEVKAHSTDGRYGKYQDGYIVVFTVDNESKTRVQCLSKKKDNWFNQLTAIQIKNPSVKKFAFTEDDKGRIIVNGVLA